MHPQWRAAVPMRLLLSFRRISIATTAILSGGIPLGIAMVGMLTLSQLRTPYAAPPIHILLNRLAKRFGRTGASVAGAEPFPLD